MISKIKIIGLPNQEIMQSNVKMPVEGRQREAYQWEIVTAVVELTKQPSFTFAAWGTHGLLHDSDSCQGMSSGAAMASGSGNLLKMQILSPPPHTNCEVLGMRPSNQIYRACQVILMQSLTVLPQQNGQDRANLLLLRVQKSGFHHFSKKKKRSSFIILAVSFTQKLIKLWFKNSKPPGQREDRGGEWSILGLHLRPARVPGASSQESTTRPHPGLLQQGRENVCPCWPLCLGLIPASSRPGDCPPSIRVYPSPDPKTSQLTPLTYNTKYNFLWDTFK